MGDIGTSLSLLADRLEGRLPNASALCRCATRSCADRGGAGEDRYPIMPQRIVNDVRTVMPEDGIVALDNGMYKIWFARNYRTGVATRFCSTTRWPRWAPVSRRQ